MSQIKVLAVKQLEIDEDDEQHFENDIVSTRFVLFQDLTDEDLEMLYEQSPDFVMEKRPDFVARKYPRKLH